MKEIYNLQRPRLKVGGESIRGDVAPDRTLIPVTCSGSLPSASAQRLLQPAFSWLIPRQRTPRPGQQGEASLLAWSSAGGPWHGVVTRHYCCPGGRGCSLIPLTFHQQLRLSNQIYSADNLQTWFTVKSSPAGGAGWLSDPSARCIVLFWVEE